MNIELMKLKLDTLEACRAPRAPDVSSRDEAIDDLQAVDRVLPDCDWFEVEQVRGPRDTASLAWSDAGMPALAFDC